jgi:hypothetical protein
MLVASLNLELTLIWSLAILVILLLLTPPIAYLYTGWFYRMDEIVAGMPEKAMILYFRQFHPQHQVQQEKVTERFRLYYKDQFGRRHFILPLILLFLISSALMIWSVFSILDWLGFDAKTVDINKAHPGHLPVLAVIAISGAYMYCISEQIQHWASWDLLPSDLLWMSFRLVIAIPTGYALSAVLKPDMAQPIAFLVGAFPTNTLMKIIRRLAVTRLDFGEMPESGATELQELQGIDLRKAERFAGEGISTILQLAYADPVKLTIRTNLGYNYMVDCISQALLAVYLHKEERDGWIRVGLRGAIEVRIIWLRGKLDDAIKRTQNEEYLEKIAVVLNYELAILKNVLEQAGDDPYSEFLYECWTASIQNWSPRFIPDANNPA